MKVLEKELKDNYDKIMDAVADDFLISDGSGTILLVSSDFENVYNIEKSYAIGKTVYELEEEGYFNPSIHAKVIQNRKKITMEQKTKNSRDILVTATPIFHNDGEIKFIVSFSRDITEMVDLQQKHSKLKHQVEKYTAEIKELRRKNSTDPDVVYCSRKMEEIMETITRVAEFDANVLLTGPSGVGKTFLAREIHRKGARAEGPFVNLNCAAIPDNLLESELFGYVKGAFTGANEKGKIGLIEMAEGGTLLLDEISEISLALQTKILKAIQEKEFLRIGGITPIRVDFRLITATNKDLKNSVSQGSFREDLYYRLNVVNIDIPSLKERREDIIPLANHFLEKENEKYDLSKGFTQEAVDVMTRYSWPGNVRELINVIERAVVISRHEDIDTGDLPHEMLSAGCLADEDLMIDSISSFSEAIEKVEKELIKSAYDRYGTSSGVATKLKLSQPTAYRKIQKYILTEEKKREKK